ncbi:MAG TPA: hypothetical protein VE914_00140 [Candidatus Angelobacter sp.]|nr:hypothetical protein [Candidatus Angelobacter sp.]
MAVGAGVVVAGMRAGAADVFLSRLEDLPLAPGLSEDATAGLSFDSAAGRIVEAYARGNLTEDQVLQFYQETLPQLGWTADNARQYRRSGERLRLDVVRSGQGLMVHYSLSPQ